MTRSEQFHGRIGRTFRESEPWWPEMRGREGRPNVLIILFDDTGFSHLGCYGSTISTPNIDSLAAGGLRFTNFHVTALCSPTRASLLTGRNHHTVGMRGIANWDPGYPNMRAGITKRAATLAEILRDEDYGTYAVGKWHLNPTEHSSAAGPFDQWPLQRGFDRYYGFLGGETDQWYPELTYDNHHVNPPRTPEQGYHLTEDLADRAIGFLSDHQGIYPDRPFFLYFALGATHSPHHAPAEYIDRYRGKFDQGWDAVREEWYARQLELGVIPPGTQLAPRNPGVEPWDSLSPNARKFMATLQETFAGFLEHTDAQLGRIVQYLDACGQLDDTLLLLLADNGASQEGGPMGVSDTSRYSQPLPDDLDEVQGRLDEIGGPKSSPNYPWGWSQAGNTPLRWYKQNTHGGGVRVPFIAHWPNRISDRGGIRRQFHHVSDVAPTVLDAAGAEAPANYRGAEQLPISGAGFTYAFDDAEAESRKERQYFEMLGHRGIWAGGWKAVTRHVKNDPWSDDEWELYDLNTDFSETNNLALEEPQRLRELIDAWWVEAGKFGVMPLDDRSWQIGGPARRPGAIHEVFRYRYTPQMSHLPSDASPPLGLGAWTISARIEREDAGQEGVIYSRGGMYGGLSFYVQDNRLRVVYNLFGTEFEGASESELPLGDCSVGLRMDAAAPSAPGTLRLSIDGTEAGSVDVPLTVRSYGRGADIGADTHSPVSANYEAPFRFSGALHEVEVEVTPYDKQSSAYQEARVQFRQLMVQQ